MIVEFFRVPGQVGLLKTDKKQAQPIPVSKTAREQADQILSFEKLQPEKKTWGEKRFSISLQSLTERIRYTTIVIRNARTAAIRTSRNFSGKGIFR